MYFLNLGVKGLREFQNPYRQTLPCLTLSWKWTLCFEFLFVIENEENWEFVIVSLEGKTWQFVAGSEEVRLSELSEFNK